MKEIELPSDWSEVTVEQFAALQNVMKHDDLHEYEKNVAIIARLPMASGILSGKFTRSTTFADNDHRNYNRDGDAFNVGETFAGIPFPIAVDLAEKFQALVPDSLRSIALAQIALRWILDFDAVTTVIPGATRIDQVENNAAASTLAPLPSALHDELKAFYNEDVASHIRGLY